MILKTGLDKIAFAAFFLLLSSKAIAIEHISAGEGSYLWLAIGFVLGGIIAFMFSLSRISNGKKEYIKLTEQLEVSIIETKETERALNSLAKEQQKNQDLLEERVQERTLELNIALQELEEANQELERKNIMDELTGLHNRRCYDQKILAEYRRSKRNLTPLSLVIIDIDYFKLVNDKYGHLAGDQCLIWLSAHIKNCLKRSSDLAFRYGGEEFCFILPDTEPGGALALAEGLRESVAAHAFHFQNIEIPITISCGI